MFIIGITGGTASGKTTIVEQVVSTLNTNTICVISQDSYYKKTDNLSHHDRINQNFDHPDSIDFDLLTKQLKDLKNGKSIEQPIYSFQTHNRIADKKYITPKNIIIVEGILIFNDKRILDLLDLTIFIHADADERLIRRILRDSKERGRTVEEVTTRYRKTLKPMHTIYIEPFKQKSDLIFDNTNKTNTIAEDVIQIIKERTIKNL
jgi:uridine kinase